MYCWWWNSMFMIYINRYFVNYAQLMYCNMLLLICGWIHDCKLWLLLMSYHGWVWIKLSYCCWIKLFGINELLLLLKFWCFEKNQFSCSISHFECCEKSLFDVFEPWDKLLNTLGEWGIKISTFGVILKETRGQTTQIRTFHRAGAWTGASAASWRPGSSCVPFFTIFLFELALGVNMNIVG